MPHSSRPAQAVLGIACCLMVAGAGAQTPALVDVRMMTDSEVNARYNSGALSSDVASGIFIGPPAIFAIVDSPDVTTGVVGPPTSSGFRAGEVPVRQALIGADFPSLLAHALRERLVGAATDAAPQSIDVAIAYFGLQSSEVTLPLMEAEDEFCFVVGGTASVEEDGAGGAEQAFARGVATLNEDMSAPLCDTLSTYAGHDGLRLRQAMRETAETMAEWFATHMLGVE